MITNFYFQSFKKQIIKCTFHFYKFLKKEIIKCTFFEEKKTLKSLKSYLPYINYEFVLIFIYYSQWNPIPKKLVSFRIGIVVCTCTYAGIAKVGHVYNLLCICLKIYLRTIIENSVCSK